MNAVVRAIADEAMPVGNGELILVVDDELLILEVAKTSLEAHNYRALAASNGIEALSRYEEYYDCVQVVLIDLMMPELDGMKAIARLRELNPQVKIIANSGSIQAIPISVGVDAFLSKPYSLKKLLSTIQLVLNSTTHCDRFLSQAGLKSTEADGESR